MTAHECVHALRSRFSVKRGWILLEQVRDDSGFDASRQIDAIAMGVWKSLPYILALEVKVNRSDFLAELRMPEKRLTFDGMVSAFYYVSPVNVIKAGEVPDSCGWFEISEKGRSTERVRAKKPGHWCHWLEIKTMPFGFVQAIMKRCAGHTDQGEENDQAN